MILASAAVLAWLQASGPGTGDPVEPQPLPDVVVWDSGPNFDPRPPSGSRLTPPPILPEDWLVVPRDAPVGDGVVFARCVLDGSPPGRIRREPLEWTPSPTRTPSRIRCAYARVHSGEDEVRMARLTGAQLLFVNGEGFVGDLDRRGFLGVPVRLEKGENHVFVLGVSDSFELELWAPRTRVVLGSWDVDWHGRTFDVLYPVFNASTSPVDHLHVHYGHAKEEGRGCVARLTDWADGGTLAPLGIDLAGSYFTSLGLEECAPSSDHVAALVPVCVYAEGDDDADRRLLRRESGPCRCAEPAQVDRGIRFFATLDARGAGRGSPGDRLPLPSPGSS